jgi:hypothetical protein
LLHSVDFYRFWAEGPHFFLFSLDVSDHFSYHLFRGYVLAALKRRHAERTGERAARRTTAGCVGCITPGVQSGLVFALCHVFLATTVSSVGVPLLLFTLWEGIIAGIVGEKYGVLPATITHGGAIFLLSSGLV